MKSLLTRHDTARAAAGLVLAAAGVTRFDAVAAPELGGVLLAAAIAHSDPRHPPYAVIRKPGRVHGLPERIVGIEHLRAVGADSPGGKAAVLLVDDVVTTGKSLVDACAAVEVAGFAVAGTACLLLRGDAAALAGRPFFAALTMDDIHQPADPAVQPSPDEKGPTA